MRLLGRLFGVVFALAIALLIGAAFWLQDANRLKPELEALIAQHTNYTARINGDVRWDLFPPLHLQIEQLDLQGDGQNIEAAGLDLSMDLSAMWENIDKWRVTKLNLTYATLVEEDATTTIEHLNVRNFQPNQPSDFSLDASYTAQGEDTPLAASLAGTFIYQPAGAGERERLTLRDTSVDADLAKGVCQADITTADNPPAELPVAGEDDLLPIAALLAYDVGADCTLTELTLGTETFHDATVEITSIDGLVNTMIDIKDFLGGTLVTDIDVDATQPTPEWTVLPEITNVDSQRLIDWTDQRMQWIAAIAFNSKIEMRGNTAAALAQSVRAQSEFDGGQGQLNIAKIKEQLMRIAIFTRQADEVEQWPDLWNYEEFTGRWNIDGRLHDLKFALDNMSVAASGDVDYLGDTIDMLAEVTVNEAPEASPFRINPLLEGTPIPIRCTGSPADPECRLDQDATQNLIARALRRDDESGLRAKLEDKIDEEVPEEYRETARSILDLLGRTFEQD